MSQIASLQDQQAAEAHKPVVVQTEIFESANRDIDFDQKNEENMQQ